MTVVIVNYNAGDKLRDCLDSLLPEIADVKHEVFVVDNGSSDGSVEGLGGTFPEVRIIANLENLGFARANNLALRQAQGTDVLLLNPDTLVGNRAIRILRSALAALPGAVAVGPKVIRPDGRLDLACRRTFPRPWVALMRLSGLSRIFTKSRQFAQYNRTYEDPDIPGEIDSGTAAALYLRREAMEAVNFFDESFFMYGEDLDLCFRLKAQGGRIYYVPDAVILHYKGVSSGQVPKLMLREFHRAMWIFYLKHYASGWGMLLSPFVWSGIKLRYQLVLRINALRGRQVVSP